MACADDASSSGRAYHHGDLRAALLERAEQVVREQGPAAVSLRSLARDLGVSHAAPAHHVGSVRGLLTALAVEGHQLLAAALLPAAGAGSFAEVGVAYVGFALEHPAHFAVMFRPDLLDLDDPALRAARAQTLSFLRGAGSLNAPDPEAAALAAWSAVHGLASLHLSGALAPDDVPALGSVATAATPDDVLALARRVTAALFASRLPEPLPPPGASRA